MFSRLANLTTFYSAENNLTGRIPSSLANASKLVELDLAGNNFHGPIPLLSNMPNIEFLVLGDNQLTSDGEVGMEFITSLSNSPKLQVFGVNSNKLTGKIPHSIGNLSKVLAQLYMGVNHFEGSIPAEISELAGLIFLSLEVNSFTGTIPSSIGGMPILQRLSLAGNKLTGNIPESLGNLANLFDMRLNQNNLIGNIPTSLGSLQRLQSLDLSVNMLNGTIPQQIVNIPNLSDLLNLSSNSLTGSLPIDIGKLNVVREIDVSKNHLSGEIPVSIGECSSLTFLDLSKNSFRGPIPNSLGDLKSLAYINLSSNELSGTITSLNFSEVVQVLDLSRNQLEGDVPREGVFLNSTVISLDGNVNLCGGMPVLELPECVVHGKNTGGRKIKLIIGTVVGSVAIIIFSCVLLLWLWKRNKSRPKVNDNVISFEGPHRLYTYHDLRTATGIKTNTSDMVTQKDLSWVTFVVFFYFVQSSNQSQGYLERLDNTTDQLSLLSFKSKIDPFGVLETWNTNTSFCNWKGVRCNNTNQRVTSLDLPNLNLAGTISPHIANLSFLSLLNLNNNSINGVLPPGLGRLLRLQYFNASNNLIQGTIPSSLGLCTRLILLNLRRNRIEGNIPHELSALLELRILMLSGNFLTGPIPPSLGNLSSLQVLTLADNSLHGLLPEELGRFPQIRNLVIDQTNITGEIPPSFLNSSSLTLLSLAANKLSGNLPSDMFSKLPNLQLFYAGRNKLTGPLPSSLSNASTLERFDLSRNNFNGQIPLLGNMPNIWFINLAENQLTSDGPGGMDFLASLANSAKLQVFAVSENRLRGKLRPSIGNLSKELSQLALGDNQLEGSLPAEISKLVGLSALSLEINFLNGNLPPSIGELPLLQRLRLHQNKFSGDIPDSFGNLAQLYEITLSQNTLTGTIPASLSNLQRLQLVDLSANMLKGTIPQDIVSITNLLVLNLSSNSLTGSVPIDIGKLKTIQTVDLSMNNLSNEIPVSIGDCLSMTILDLSRNSFQGSIPDTIGNLKSIEYLSLSSNKLSGKIPSSLTTLEFIKFLNLSMNELEGDVPKEGIFINSTVAHLNGNQNLCGGIPALELRNCIVHKKQSGRSKQKLIIGIVTGFIVSGIFLCSFFLLIRKRKTGKANVIEDVISFEGPQRLYTYHDLRIATDNFNADNFMSNGSLDQWLYKPIGSGLEFNMKHRLQVAKEVAYALEYLHHDYETPMVHCDLKPSNILLDKHMTAHVGDFGLARIVHQNSEVPLSSTLVLNGSIGYIAPEYGMGGEVSCKGDVYSFGILVLEMFTGKRPTNEDFTGELDLHKWVTTALSGQIMDVINPEYVQQGENLSLVSMLKLGLTCSAKLPDDRPTMRDVSTMIRNIKT
ncbi:Receptor kinase-like protein xa21 [Thalictrum thalictroides]|uniref:non-specific serine/threonine protein kinase n=1 Tax=Thalictrum thalictroides TaxID=46969 RepID=A0A7J6VQX3_THATH|nr:Receptor kinase-like protein xa21 [Thalictrum thalictroides]